MKKILLAELIPNDIEITELDAGQLEGAWAGIENHGCVNTEACGGVGQGTNCGNIELCLVASSPAGT